MNTTADGPADGLPDVEGTAGIEDQFRHVAGAFLAQELQGQERAQRVGGRDHLRPGKLGGLDERAEVDALQQRQEQEQTGDPL